MSYETLSNLNGKKHRLTFYINGRRYRTPYFSKKHDALKWKEDKVNGLISDDMPTFKKAALDRHEKHSKLNNRDSTIIKDEGMFKELFPVFYDKKLSEIKTSHVEDHLTFLKSKGLSKASLRLRVSLIKSIFNWHIKRGLNVFNPCLAIQIKVNSQAPEHWTEKDAVQFLDYTKNKYSQKFKWIHLLYALALNTGCRWGEVIGLEWSKVNIHEKRILINQIYDEIKTDLVPTTKSGKFRYVGINDTLYELLLAHETKNNTGLLFKNLVGNKVDRRNFRRRHFTPDMKEAGVKRIKFHSLRDTYATIYMANGGNIYHLKELLGHSSLTMTQKYAHFHPDHATQHANVVNIGGEGKVIQVNFKKANS